MDRALLPRALRVVPRPKIGVEETVVVPPPFPRDAFR
jgi:hypothetical protein